MARMVELMGNYAASAATGNPWGGFYKTFYAKFLHLKKGRLKAWRRAQNESRLTLKLYKIHACNSQT